MFSLSWFGFSGFARTKRQPFRKTLQRKLQVDELEPRLCMSAGPGDTKGPPPPSISVVFDNSAPKTNDLLTANLTTTLQGPIFYQYDWTVNGTLVKTTQTFDMSDNLDLSQPGNGDKNDVIELTVSVDASPMAGASATVANSAPVITAPGDQQFLVGDPVSLQIQATDPDGDPITFTGDTLPEGLSIDTSGLITGTVGGDTVDLNANLQASDGTDQGTAAVFCSVAAIDITGVGWVTPAAGGNLTIGNNATSTLTFRVTGTGIPNFSRDLYFSVLEGSTALWSKRPITISADAAGTVNQTKSFYLFSGADGTVRGPDGTSGLTTITPVVAIRSYWAEQARTPAGGPTIFGTANAAMPGTGNESQMTTSAAAIALPAGWNGTLVAADSPIVTFNFTVTVNGTPGQTITGLRWSVIERDNVFDDWLYKQRTFNVTIGANGQGTFTSTFFLYAGKSWLTGWEVGGIDDWSGESAPTGIYVYVQNSGGTEKCRSAEITPRCAS
jgi:hypothetical protein